MENVNEKYWDVETVAILDKYIQLLRETDRVYFRDEIKKLLQIKKSIYLNQKLTDEQIEYIRNIKNLYEMFDFI